MKRQPASRISLDEMWTYAGSRRPGKRNSVWIWTAAVDGRKGVVEVGDPSERTLRLTDRLPVAQTYHTDASHADDRLPHNPRIRDKFGEVNRNEGAHLVWRG